MPVLKELDNYEDVLRDIYRWNIRMRELISQNGGNISDNSNLCKYAGDPSESSLHNIRTVASALGNPQDSFKIIHIAGTNGKGSVCLKTAAALQKAGFRCGMFTSPHVSCFRERILVNDDKISE